MPTRVHATPETSVESLTDAATATANVGYVPSPMDASLLAPQLVGLLAVFAATAYFVAIVNGSAQAGYTSEVVLATSSTNDASTRGGPVLAASSTRECTRCSPRRPPRGVSHTGARRVIHHIVYPVLAAPSNKSGAHTQLKSLFSHVPSSPNRRRYHGEPS